MIIPGRSLIPRVISNVRSAAIQAQSCGVDLTLKRILIWTSAGSIDFDNTHRANASTIELPWADDHSGDTKVRSLPRQIEAHQPALKNSRTSAPELQANHQSASIFLTEGSYLVEFNESVDVPLDLMGQIFVRSSLFRSGALLSAGVMDSGYKGAVGAMMQVVNRRGLRLYRDARLAQMVFHRMSEAVQGYTGTYQGRQTV